MTWKWPFFSVIILIYVQVLGLIFVFLVPPFQKPDEIIHWRMALAVIYPQAKAPNRYVSLPDKFKAEKIAFNNNVRLSVDKFLYRDTDKAVINLSYLRHKLINPFGYLPVVLGIRVGTFFDYPIVSFWMARFIGLLLLMLSLIWSLKTIGEKYKIIILMYALLPMVIHQVTSISYDVMPLVLVPMIFTFLVRLLDNIKVDKWDLWGLAGGVFLFILAKSGYYLFLLLIYIGLRKVYPKIINKLSGLFIILLFFLGYFGMRIFYFLVITFWGVGEGIISPRMQYLLLGQDRLYLVKIIWNSLVSKWEFYIQTFLGYFGWLDYKYDFMGYVVIVVMLILLLKDLIKADTKTIISKKDLLILVLIIVGTFATLMLYLDFTWTSVGAKVIEGMTGRYVLVLFPFLVFVFLEIIMMVGKSRAKKFLFGLVILVVSINTYKAVYNRYYDLSGRFKNENELKERVADLKKAGEDIVRKNLNSEISFLVGISPGEEINGFSLYFYSRDLVSRVPYRYFIKNRDCNVTLKDGYLNQEDLRDENVINESFGVIRPKDDALCVVIRPVVIDKKEKYISLGTVEENPLFNFLVPEKEQIYK